MDNPKISAIVTGGTSEGEESFYLPFLKQAFFHIAADSGLEIYFRLEIKPHIVIGDLDSVSDDAFEWAERNDIPLQSFPEEKDATDTQLAVDAAINMQCDELYILGGIGSRLDHTLANLNLLVHSFEKGVHARLLDPENHIQLLTPGFMVQVQGRPGDLVSILPVGKDLRGLNAQGVHWPLKDDTMRFGGSRGISNYLEEDHASFSLKEGMAFVMQVRER